MPHSDLSLGRSTKTPNLGEEGEYHESKFERTLEITWSKIFFLIAKEKISNESTVSIIKVGHEYSTALESQV